MAKPIPIRSRRVPREAAVPSGGFQLQAPFPSRSRRKNGRAQPGRNGSGSESAGAHDSPARSADDAVVAQFTPRENGAGEAASGEGRPGDAGTRAGSRPSREWPSVVGRTFLTNIKMGMSAMTEVSNVAKNVLDHSISLAERLAFGKDYLEDRLRDYRGQRRVAFLFPGYLQGSAAFERMERIMESELFGVFPVTLTYHPYSQDIRKSAEKVRKQIDRVLRETEARRVYLIGHSQGGLIGRYIVQVMDGHGFVSHCITLATPHMGTYAAAVGGVGHGMATAALSRLGLIPRIEGESGLQMIPGSRLLSEMNHRPLPPQVEFTSIYNYMDPLVWPASYARMPYEDAHNILLKKIGHFHALYDIQELEIILRTLLLRIKRGLIYKHQVLAGQQVLEERHMEMVGHEVGEFVAASD